MPELFSWHKLRTVEFGQIRHGGKLDMDESGWRLRALTGSPPLLFYFVFVLALLSHSLVTPTKTDFPMSLSGSVSSSSITFAWRPPPPPRHPPESSTTAEQFQTSSPLQLRVNIGTAATLIPVYTRTSAKSSRRRRPRFCCRSRRRLRRTQSPTFLPT